MRPCQAQAVTPVALVAHRVPHRTTNDNLLFIISEQSDSNAIKVNETRHKYEKDKTRHVAIRSQSHHGWRRAHRTIVRQSPLTR